MITICKNQCGDFNTTNCNDITIIIDIAHIIYKTMQQLSRNEPTFSVTHFCYLYIPNSKFSYEYTQSLTCKVNRSTSLSNQFSAIHCDSSKDLELVGISWSQTTDHTRCGRGVKYSLHFSMLTAVIVKHTTVDHSIVVNRDYQHIP